MHLRTILPVALVFLCTHSRAQFPDSFTRRVSAISDPAQRLEQYITYLEPLAARDFNAAMAGGAPALRLARSLGNTAAAGRIERVLGEASYFKGQYDVAAGHLYRSVQLLENSGQPVYLGHSLNALAKLYRKTRDLPRALQHYERALGIFREAGDSAGVSMILNESGVVFEYAGNYDAAAARYSASLRIDEERRDPLGISYALSNLAGVFILQKKFAAAEQFLLRALRVRQELKDSFALALTYSDLGSLYLSAQDLGSARSYTDTSNRLAAAMGYRELQRNNLDLLARIAEAGGNNAAALALYRQKSALQDSLFSLEKARSIEELNTRFETLKKEQTIREQQFALDRKNLLLIASAALLVLGTALAYSGYRRRRLVHRHALQQLLIQQQEAATRAIIEAEESERQRIAKELHDGVGQMMSAARMNLSSLGSRLPLGDADNRKTFDNVITLVDESCREVRAVSHNMMPNALLRSSLAAALRAFIDKIDIKALQVHLYTEGLDDRLEDNVQTVLYRVVQECVNNVIRHSGASRLDISLIREGNELTATIEDNGSGFDPQEAAQGLGLRNIRTRIGYLKGSVDFDSRPGRGTLVAFTVPLQERI
ncbi:tetratricopeptide repeat protein [Flaviaesturariibacter flavus]|uniref:Oxygen sensor histidine kinase NreB n=1 Tax=Flaviaesturariibacter flavus TaxID=2502780 RepID=A0A4R1B3E0_9BACT|nr:sensor histidine kinase [Flaviaesturariibacter flavus]TCJ12000.1 tetratricopeptide repeat protein [Flaviaesturariibacter flavus]